MNSKKALGMGTLAILIISLAVLFTLGFFSDAIAGIITGKGDIETCRLSVLAQAQTKVLGEALVNLKCPRRQVTIFEDKVEINDKKSGNYKFQELSNDAVNRVIAEELRSCWYKMGEGEVDVFQQEVYGFNENVCVICSEIDFDKKIDQTKKFTGLLDYLKSNKIPGGKANYFDYLIRSQRNLYLLWGYIPWTHYTPWGLGTTDLITSDLSNVGNFEENLQKYSKTKDSEFRTNQNYVVYFLGFKPPWANELIKATKSAYYIGLGTPDKLTKECSRLQN